MRTSTAYFAGAGTVIAAIAAGLGGGLLFANMISPNPPTRGAELSRLEKRMAPEPIQAMPGSPEPVQYLAAPQLSASGTASVGTTVATVAASAPASTVQVQPQTEAVNGGATGAQPVDTSIVAQSVNSTPQTAAAAPQPGAREQIVASEDASTRAPDADVKRAAEKRQIERRQQWAEKRRQRQRQELMVIEQKVREETAPPRESAIEPVRIEMPQIRLFGSD